MAPTFKRKTAYDPIFESSGPTYVAPTPPSDISNPLGVVQNYSRVPEIQSFEYEPSRVFNKDKSDGQWHVPKSYSALVFFGDILLTLSPIVFIVFAFRASVIDGQPLSDDGDAVVQAAKLGPTVFPIVFAAVVGRLMRTSALWKAERGCELGILEQLVGSQNLLAAIERVFLLRNFGLIGVGIILLWALSPLGGQSSLRIIGTTEQRSPGTQQVFYFDVNNSYSSLGGASAIAYADPGMSAIYRACLLAPHNVQRSATDLWNNPKIPILELLPGFDPNSDQTRWTDVPDIDNLTYSSMTGLMIANTSSGKTSNFTLETSYFNVDCPVSRTFTLNYSINATQDLNGFYGGFVDWLGNLSHNKNKTNYVFGERAAGQSYSTWNSFMVDTNWNYSDLNNLNPPSVNLIYASQGGADGEVAAYNCTLSTSRVESSVSCTNSTCRVDRMRRSLNDTRPAHETPWNSGNPVYMGNFLNWFPFAAGEMHDAVISPTDLYVMGSDSPFSIIQPVHDYKNVGGAQAGVRLTTLVNTVWQASMATTSISSPPPKNLTELSTGEAGYTAANTTASTVTSTTLYAASKLWVSLTAIISVLLLCCGLAGMAFKYLTRTPDILGYVSTMTRDNPYFEGPQLYAPVGSSGSTNGAVVGVGRGGDVMDGLERARVLRKVNVQIADVKPWENGGHIALKSVRSR